MGAGPHAGTATGPNDKLFDSPCLWRPLGLEAVAEKQYLALSVMVRHCAVPGCVVPKYVHPPLKLSFPIKVC